MKKKGRSELGFGIISLIVIIGATIYGSIALTEQNRFIGDTTTRLVYDNSKCNVDAIIKPENQVRFKSFQEASGSGYANAPNCI